MAKRTTELEPELEIRRLMDELHIDRDGAVLLYTVEQGYGLVDDRLSLSEDESQEDALETMRRPPASPVSDGTRKSA
jgi:hypothetical protein